MVKGTDKPVADDLADRQIRAIMRAICAHNISNAVIATIYRNAPVKKVAAKDRPCRNIARPA
jgi:hypothetical protein